LILPGKFIEIAEESSLICDLGEAFLDRVCEDLIEWQAAGYNVPVSLNISAVQLAMARFSDTFLNKIYSCGLRPDQFELEITENVIIRNLEMTLENIIKLTKLGVNIAVDDFGKGYSSLSYLDQLPLKTLKLDMSFIRKIDSVETENSIIPAMLNVSNGLKLNFVVEGVENRAQHDYLLEQGSCIAQGFYYSRPVSGTDMLNLLQSHQPVAARVGENSIAKSPPSEAEVGRQSESAPNAS
jgi:EAL domain-containing protein (putative c-di-GMP-specific phosphodiesterase class I)